MELQQFIKETIIQIVAGVTEADEAIKGSGAAVNPPNVFCPAAPENPYGAQMSPADNGFGRIVEAVSFDIAVTTGKGKGTEGGIGVRVAGIALGSSGESSTTSGSESRVQFRVPVRLPLSKNAESPRDDETY